MIVLLDHYKQVAVYSVVLGCMTFSLNCKLHSGFYSCRNLYLYSFTLAYESASVTALAWIADDLTLAAALLACRICYSLSEERIYNPLYLPGTVTCRAILYIRTVLRAFAGAVAARYVLFDVYFLFDTFGDFFQCEFYSYSDITASVHSLLSLAAAKSSSESAETTESASERTAEEVVEDIIEIAESTAEIRARAFYS